jgi:signal transduction histidine kinase
MAVKPERTPMARDYWPSFQKGSTWFIIITQLLVTLVIGGALIGAGVFDLTDTAFLLSIFATCFASLAVNLIAFSLITEPFHSLLNAIVHAAGEPTTATLPNPNAKQYSKSGFKQVIQTVYELGTSAHALADKSTTSDTSAMIERALNTTTTGFAVLNKHGKILYSNKAAPIKLNSNNSQELQLEFQNEITLDDWIATCEQHEVHATRIWHRVANKLPGEEDRRIFDIIASYQKGSTAEVVLSFIDYTDQYIPEEEELNFIAFAAHELRGPITVIRGYLDVLDDELGSTIAAEQKELLSRLVVSANRLSSYVNNILNASRYDRRHLKVHLKEDTITDIYASIADDMQMRASAQQRLLSVAIPENLPTVAADRGSISEVLGNLIDNGIKYSHEGGIVTVAAEAKGDFVEISVTDNGIGMPGNVVENLFHKFYRSHRSRETVAGTGIGLYICKAFVESHGGTISVRSAEGQGSTFMFTLPIYSTVEHTLNSDNSSNESLIRKREGWIKNHSMYRG